MTYLHSMPLWALFLGVIFILAGAEILGTWLGARSNEAQNEGARGHVAGTAGAVLGLLALLLGFSFSIAVGRYEGRRILVVSEANAIGTAWLRTQLLPAPYDTAAARLLGKYVDSRLRLGVLDAEGAAPEQEEGIAQAIQDTLWLQVRQVAAVEPRQSVISLYTSAINEVIDLQASRHAASWHGVPAPIFWALVLTAAFAVGVGAYGAALTGARHRGLRMAVALLFAILIALVADLDRPRRGFIRTPQAPLEELQRTIHAVGPRRN